MAAHVCPWWSAWFTINNPLRRLLHDPQQIVGPYVEPGMTVMDVGCGAGWFSIPMARMVGDQGRVLAVDLQPQMLDMVRRRREGRRGGPHPNAPVSTGSTRDRCPGRLRPDLCHGPRSARSRSPVRRDPRLPETRRQAAPGRASAARSRQDVRGRDRRRRRSRLPNGGTASASLVPSGRAPEARGLRWSGALSLSPIQRRRPPGIRILRASCSLGSAGGPQAACCYTQIEGKHVGFAPTGRLIVARRFIAGSE